MLGRMPTFDVIVSDDGSRVVWHPLRDEIIPAIVALRTLAPGELIELSGDWNLRDDAGATVVPGTYTARGVLLLEGASPETSPVSFTIADRQ